MGAQKRYRKLVKRARAAGLHLHLILLRDSPETSGYIRSASDPADLRECMLDADALISKTSIPSALDDYGERWPAAVRAEQERMARFDSLIEALRKADVEAGYDETVGAKDA